MKNHQLFLIFLSFSLISFGSENPLFPDQQSSASIQHNLASIENSSIVLPEQNSSQIENSSMQEIEEDFLKNGSIKVGNEYAIKTTMEKVETALQARATVGILFAVVWQDQTDHRVHFILDPKKDFSQVGSVSVIVYDFKCTTDTLKDLPLMKLTFGNNVVVINEQQFARAQNIRNVIIPETVKKIEKYAFSGCSAKEITICEGDNFEIDNPVTIKKGAFAHCCHLQKLSIFSPEAVIKKNVIEFNPQLKEIIIPVYLEGLGNLTVNSQMQIKVHINDFPLSYLMKYRKYKPNQLQKFVLCVNNTQTHLSICFLFKGQTFSYEQIGNLAPFMIHPPELQSMRSRQDLVKDVIQLFIDFQQKKIKRLSDVFSSFEKVECLFSCIRPSFLQQIVESKYDENTKILMFFIRFLFCGKEDLFSDTIVLLQKINPIPLFQVIEYFILAYEKGNPLLMKAIFDDDQDSFCKIVSQNNINIETEEINSALLLNSINIFKLIVLQHLDKINEKNFIFAALGENFDSIHILEKEKKFSMEDMKDVFYRSVINQNFSLAAYIAENYSNWLPEFQNSYRRMCIFNRMVISDEDIQDIFDQVFKWQLGNKKEQKEKNRECLDNFIFKINKNDEYFNMEVMYLSDQLTEQDREAIINETRNILKRLSPNRIDPNSTVIVHVFPWVSGTELERKISNDENEEEEEQELNFAIYHDLDSEDICHALSNRAAQDVFIGVNDICTIQ